ncbi:phytanoyl-CoA dioxygenase family protein [Paracraurococcus ruber]|uniref:Phytanoyl-CoA dioxygenase n=1 Tax=Paracraurococcus ruber TaxID=77675 RepID=A0ABS1CYX4_9PROT|nr:phytanoyl-CoA dioxygenase family protein [Paracraurococcus ruber]MBK1659712.1 hypothetical protein [Paracraurococcus ruber]TDG29641.1 hypothetical protein E2C05_17335 [Paracraurococcus ruber]
MQSYARLSPGPGFRPMRAAFYYSQRLVTRPRLRRGVAACLAAAQSLRAGRGQPDAADAATLAALHRDGIAPLRPLLPPAALREVMDWLAPRPVQGPDGPVPLAALPEGTASAAYALDAVLACPHLLDLANHPAVLALAEAYLGCRPTLSSIGLRWSLPRPHRCDDVQHFHRDPDDWRFLKLFLYLTDVDARNGPHIYVHGSHRRGGRVRARPYAAAEAARFGAVTPVFGPAGTCFVADTWGIHAGAVPLDRPRLLLQAQYSVLPVFAFDYAPRPVQPARPLDPWVNRLLVAPVN